MAKNKGRRRYMDGTNVKVNGQEFVITGYSYPSMEYVIRRNDGLTTLVKENEVELMESNHIKE